MAGVLKNLECNPIKIGGMEDHVHILFALSKNIAFIAPLLTNGMSGTNKPETSVALSGRNPGVRHTQG
jgi:hypothetical protein